MNDSKIEELKKQVISAELRADLKDNPELKAQIEKIISSVDSQRLSVDDAVNDVVQLINQQVPRL